MQCIIRPEVGSLEEELEVGPNSGVRGPDCGLTKLLVCNLQGWIKEIGQSTFADVEKIYTVSYIDSYL